jgi:hypothetical protein
VLGNRKTTLTSAYGCFMSRRCSAHRLGAFADLFNLHYGLSGLVPVLFVDVVRCALGSEPVRK